jgi:four helix bundle protein
LWSKWKYELAHFLHIAMGSASELHYQIILAKDLNLLVDTTSKTLESDIEEVKRMLSALIGKIKNESSKL